MIEEVMMKIPQGYKQTEVGVIPEDWDCTQTQDYIKDISMGPFGSDIKVDNFVSEGVPVLNGMNVSECKLIDKFDHFVTDAKANSLKKAVAVSGDIVITHRGTLGQVSYIPKTAKYQRYVISQSQFRVRFSDAIYPDYIVRYLLSPIGQERLLEFRGHTGVPALAQPTTNFRNLLLIIPPVEEQRRIAEALSDVDKLIAALDKKIVKKKLIKQAAMQQLLTGKKRLQGFNDILTKITLGQIGDWYKGQPFAKTDIVENGKYECIHYGELFTAYKEVISDVISKTNSMPKITSKDRDILFPASDVTPIGLGRCSAILKNNVILGGDIIILRLHEHISSEYIGYLVNQNKQQIIDRVTGTTVKHINSTLLSEITINITPNYKEQQAIAKILSDIDEEILDLERKRDKHQLLKSGMMQKLLIGQIRLRKSLADIIPLTPNVSREIPLQAHIIAGHIVNKLHNSYGLGRTKLQKAIHLIVYHCQLDLGSEFIRNTAGPDDQVLMNYIDGKFRQYNHVRIEVKMENGKHWYTYTPTAMISEVEQVYETYPSHVSEKIDALLEKIKSMDLARAEIVSTLYAVWNNRVIKGESITDELLLNDFYAWSAHKSDFSRDLVLRGLDYMRNVGLVPTGWGKYINKK